MEALAERLDSKLKEWTPETAAQVRERISEIIEWADLADIWTFVDDKPVFLAYIQREVGRRLDGLATPEPEAEGSAVPDSTGG